MTAHRCAIGAHRYNRYRGPKKNRLIAAPSLNPDSAVGTLTLFVSRLLGVGEMPFQTCQNCRGTVEYPVERRGTVGSCPFCGFEQWIGTAAPMPVQANHPSGITPGVAALLSFLIPGLGQLCRGNTGKGVGFFFAALLGYMLFIVPGLIIHICVVVDAATSE